MTVHSAQLTYCNVIGTARMWWTCLISLNGWKHLLLFLQDLTLFSSLDKQLHTLIHDQVFAGVVIQAATRRGTIKVIVEIVARADRTLLLLASNTHNCRRVHVQVMA